MISIDFSNRAVLVTGGTRGFGRAIAKEFSRGNATVYVTHRWGSVEESELSADFAREGLRPPVMVECDASDQEATRALMARIHADGRGLHAIISNAAFGKVVKSVDEYSRSALNLTIAYSAWPLVELIQAASALPGMMPKYLMGISVDPHCHDGYDLLGASKKVLETLVQYLALRLKTQGVRVNAIIPGSIDSVSLEATIGAEVASALRARGDVMLDPARLAKTCVALASGLMDSVTGQMLLVDEGWSLVSPVQMLSGHVAPFAFPEEKPR